jgi:aspartokinase
MPHYYTYCSVSGVDRVDHCCVLAAVGEGMVERRGVAATMMGALAKANVNIKAMAQVGVWCGGGVWSSTVLACAVAGAVAVAEVQGCGPVTTARA